MKREVFFGCRTLLLGMLYMLCNVAYAQNTEETDDTIHLSKKFLQSIEDAFLFTPRIDTLRYEENPLTREQLHEWIGEPQDAELYWEERRNALGEQQSMNAPADSLDSLDIHLRDKLRYSIPNLVVTPPPSFNFAIDLEGIVIGKSKNGKYSVIQKSGGGQAISGFDFGAAMGRLFIPKDRRLYKSRKLAKENKAVMDAAFPL